MPAKVRCVHCGYLAARELGTRQIVEIEPQVRERWEVPNNPEVLHLKRHEELPFCFARAADLRQEIEHFTPQRVLTVINRERDCSQFCEYELGKSPPEHAEMGHFKEMERIAEERKRGDEARAEERRREDKDRQDRRDDEQRSWQTSENAKTRLLQKITVGVTVVAGIVGVLLAKYLPAPQPQPVIIQTPTATQPTPAK